VYIAGDALSALRYDGYSYADQAMMILSAVDFPGWFRRYAPATTAVVVGFGIASSPAMRGLAVNDTPVGRRLRADQRRRLLRLARAPRGDGGAPRIRRPGPKSVKAALGGR